MRRRPRNSESVDKAHALSLGGVANCTRRERAADISADARGETD